MPHPPSGRVTFLFTDIEGSTKAWDAHRDGMAVAVADHDALLRDAIEARGGYVFKTVGDAFCAAFADPAAALGSALAAQRALAERRWAGVGSLRIRVALHAGEAEERAADYFGPTVNRVARLLSAGHGGQVLLSQAAADALADRLADGLALRDLGDRRLKDLTQPERVYQILASDLPDAFPPLNTLDARPNNLPAQPTPLLGREDDVAAVKARVRDRAVRLLTLTGPGGTGKTRLALQAAADLIDDFPHGVWFVDLSAVADPDLVPAEIASALGVTEERDGSLEDQVLAYLANRELLLVLDNFEQILAAATAVGRLVGACPKLKLLVTSRAPLRISGEQEFPVDPLPVPDPAGWIESDRLEAFPSVELFVQRARAVKPGFALAAENARAVAAICAALDGLPLAIELAAARVRLLAPQAMLPRLADRLALLTGGARDKAARQQTLRGAIAWSHDLLAAPEQPLFARLAVFAGSCDFAAAEAVANAAGDLDLLDGMDALVQHSLVRQEDGPEGEPRFRMLATIREYAAERLEERGEAEAVRQAHAGYFFALAEHAQPELTGPAQATWFDRLDREHDNLRTAFDWLGRQPDATDQLRLGSSLLRFWLVRGHLGEGRVRLERALAAAPGASVLVRADALHAAGTLASARGEHAAAVRLHDEALALFRSILNESGIARALHSMGLTAEARGDVAEAVRLYEEALALHRKLGDHHRLADTLNDLGLVALNQGDYDRAATLVSEALALWKDAGDEQAVSIALNALGAVALHQNDADGAALRFEESLTIQRALGVKLHVADSLANLAHARHRQGALGDAQDLFEEALRSFDELGEKGGTAFVLAHLGQVHRDQGDLGRAAELLVSSVGLSHEFGELAQVAEGLEALATVACARDDAERAILLFGAAESLRESIGVPRPPVHHGDVDAAIGIARSVLDPSRFAGAWDRGTAMTIEQAVSAAAGLRQLPRPPA